MVDISGNLKLVHLQGVDFMSHAARKRAGHGRIQPYAWLGAGALTLGMGAAMVGGTAVAFADTGSDSAGATHSADKAGNDSSASTSTVW